ncbi:MAG: carboxylesterase/lipase family protein [Bryobacteraceae bacterium]
MRNVFQRREFLKLAGLSGMGVLPLGSQTGAAASSSPVVETACGKVRGESANGISSFKGIPYGGDTSGKNRFMPPTKPAPWRGIRDATQWGHVAPQRVGAPTEYSSMVRWQTLPGGQGEDCLVLNVWTPNPKSGGKRPVLFSIHGGGFANGTSGNPVFDGYHLAKNHDAVVVTINHRLGPLGYLHLGDLSPEFSSSGVAGMLDCVAALEWVRDNIDRFGGDPGRVMIFGQSGGGSKTSFLQAMPSAKGLFQRAAMESGVAVRAPSRENATENTEKLLAQLGLNKTQLRDLQNIPFDKLVNTAAGAFSPIVDGKEISHLPFDPANHLADEIPIIVGSCLHDSALSITDFSLDDAGMRAQARKNLGANADAIVNAYRKADPKDSPSLLMARMNTDRGLRRNSIAVAERRNAGGRALAYMYRIDWRSVPYNGKFGAVHGVDVPMVFDNVNAWPLVGTSAQAVALAHQMSSAWVAFARTGDPNTSEIPKWPAYRPDTRATMIFDAKVRVDNAPDRDLLSLWDSTNNS